MKVKDGDARAARWGEGLHLWGGEGFEHAVEVPCSEYAENAGVGFCERLQAKGHVALAQCIGGNFDAVMTRGLGGIQQCAGVSCVADANDGG